MDVDLGAAALVWVAYAAATLSPGPASLAIVGLAAGEGRSRALPFAMGVVIGSMVWGVVASLGLVGAMMAAGWTFTLIKVAGAAYLGWMAWRSLRAALGPATRPPTRAMPADRLSLVVRGVLFHLTNPKAAFAWAALVSIGLTPDASGATIAAMLAGCAVLGVLTFGGTALAFSSPAVAALYARGRRWVQGFAALVFGAFALRLATLKPV